jgi:hypothetical protein
MTLGGQAAACRNQQRQGISSPFPRFALPNNGSPIPTGARKIPNAGSSFPDRENAIPAAVRYRSGRAAAHREVEGRCTVDDVLQVARNE